MNNDLKHHGVKGMKWGVRRYQNKDGSLKPAGKKKGKSLMKKYSDSLDKANAKSAAGTAKRKAAVKAAPKKALSGYKNALEKADAKSAERTAKRKETTKKVAKEANRKLPNAAVGIAAGLAINSVVVGPASMAGRALLGGSTGALLGAAVGSTFAVNQGIDIYNRMMDNSNKK